jgi:hypothetical protein
MLFISVVVDSILDLHRHPITPDAQKEGAQNAISIMFSRVPLSAEFTVTVQSRS